MRAQLIAILPDTTASTCHKQEADGYGSRNDKERVLHGFQSNCAMSATAPVPSGRRASRLRLRRWSERLPFCPASGPGGRRPSARSTNSR
jgi:hypothetical protein